MKQQKLLDRIDKINLLKDLGKGRKLIQDLIPETVRFWYCRDDNCSSGDLKLNREEFEQYSRARPKQRNIIFTLQDGNGPLADEQGD
jgi:hypothetical protein